MSNQFNPYEHSTLQANWYEDRFFHANTRNDEPLQLVRPEHDEVENIPRIARRVKPTGEVFKMENDESPEDHYTTVSMATYVQHNARERSVTEERMNTTNEHLREILDFEPTQFIPNYSTKPIPPNEQFKTTYQSSYPRHF